MARPYWFALAAAALIAAAAGWWLLRPVATPRDPDPATLILSRSHARVPSEAERSAMTAQATQACRCARRLPDGSPARQRCWARFERMVGRYEHSEMSSACVPLSTTLVCFGETGAECIVRDHGGGACTAEEARTLDAIWSRWAGDDQASMDRAGRRLDEAVQAFIRGDRVRAPRPSGTGCSG